VLVDVMAKQYLIPPRGIQKDFVATPDHGILDR
jgi:hypothetical protein